MLTVVLHLPMLTVVLHLHMLTAVLHLHMLTAVHTLLVWDQQTNFEERETRKGQIIISYLNQF